MMRRSKVWSAKSERGENVEAADDINNIQATNILRLL